MFFSSKWKISNSDPEGFFNQQISPTSTEVVKHRTRTEISSTVFSGTPESWVAYLNLNPTKRILPGEEISVLYDPYRLKVAFEGNGELASHLAPYLNIGLKTLEQLIAPSPYLVSRFNTNLFGNQSNEEAPIKICFSHHLPSEAVRELHREPNGTVQQITLVAQLDFVQAVAESVAGTPKSAEKFEILGRVWPLLGNLLSRLFLPSRPRDRFTEKIRVVSEVAFLSLNLLYQGSRMGQLQPNRAGEICERFVCHRKGIEPKRLFEDHGFFRLLSQIGFLHGRSLSEEERRIILILVRDYLDKDYIRLSLAGIMPDVHPSMQPMDFTWKKHRKLQTPSPRPGKFGVIDKDDLKAWKKVGPEFNELGFTLIRQLGMGDFGRVYEAVNRQNATFPQRVAVKVDRIQKGSRVNSIAAVNQILQIGEKLAGSPHVIRVYDAGILANGKFTYHIIQFVDGDTLDHLLEFAGFEHSSLNHTDLQGASHQLVESKIQESFARSKGEIWRKRRSSNPFTAQLTLPQLLDILTSKLLWLEECHALGFAIHDLKNGNLMINRNGQLKGIDLDSYAPIFSPLDKMADFVFLSVSFLLLFLNSTTLGKPSPQVSTQAISDPSFLRRLFEENWNFESVEKRTGGRVGDEAIRQFFRDLVLRARTNQYGNEPGLFSSDIERLIRLKRLAYFEDIVLD
ncbi:MAG: protein kinase [Puniceicoccaceae bacterium]